MLATIKAGLTNLLSNQDWNYRFVYLTQGMVSAAGVLILVFGFIYTEAKSDYPFMVLAVAGGSGGAAVLSKYLRRTTTNKDGSVVTQEVGENKSESKTGV